MGTIEEAFNGFDIGLLKMSFEKDSQAKFLR